MEKSAKVKFLVFLALKENGDNKKLKIAAIETSFFFITIATIQWIRLLYSDSGTSNGEASFLVWTCQNFPVKELDDAHQSFGRGNERRKELCSNKGILLSKGPIEDIKKTNRHFTNYMRTYSNCSLTSRDGRPLLSKING